jgi:glutamate carboxypeptidase
MLPLLLLTLSLDPVERKIAAAVDAEQERTVALIETLVNINSGTMNTAGVRAVARVLEAEFREIGLTPRFAATPELKRAGHLLVESVPAQPAGKRLLLIGHMDTVFEPDSPFQKFVRQGARATGPGCEDMKGGLAVMIAALRALKAAGVLEKIALRIVLTGDEENPGTPLREARRLLVEAGDASDIALEFEPAIQINGREYGSTSRRSAQNWVLRARAKTGHSGQIFSEAMGSGAAFEIARILTAFHAELREKYVTFNAGIVAAGARAQLAADESSAAAAGKSNIVAEEAVVFGDLRTISPEQNQRIQEKMQAIVARHLPGTTATLEFREGYPPMAPEKNRGLLRELNAINRDLGVPEMEELDPMRRGAGDISFVAAKLESLTGFGAIGDGAHAPGEWIDLTKVALQGKRAALMIYRLGTRR